MANWCACCYDPQVNRRAVKEVLKLCASKEDIDFTIKVSLLEIYNEKILDLLSDLPAPEQNCDASTSFSRVPAVECCPARRQSSTSAVDGVLAATM